MNKKDYKLISLLFVCIICLTACKADEVKLVTNESSIETTMEFTTAIADETIINIVEKANTGTLNSELADVEKKSNELNSKLATDASLTQTDMNLISYDVFNLWDAELNSLWKRIKEKDKKEDFKKLQDEERQWIKDKEAEMKKAGAAYEGGTMQPLIMNTKGAELTRLRCYELADYLGKLIGESVDPVPFSYEGRYVDTQGTDTAYSDIQMRDNKNGTYACKINIYRLCQLEGTATDKGNGKFEFVGIDPNDTKIKGTIEINGKYAMFTVTDSNWNYLPNGESFKFMEKWDLSTAEAQGY